MQNSIGIFIRTILDLLTFCHRLVSHLFDFLDMVVAEPLYFDDRLLSQMLGFSDCHLPNLSGFLLGAIDNAQFIGNSISALVCFGDDLLYLLSRFFHQSLLRFNDGLCKRNDFG